MINDADIFNSIFKYIHVIIIPVKLRANHTSLSASTSTSISTSLSASTSTSISTSRSVSTSIALSA
jgi:hypothetical protein